MISSFASRLNYDAGEDIERLSAQRNDAPERISRDFDAPNYIA